MTGDMSAVEASAQTLSQEERTALAQEERAIARKYVGGTPWLMVAWGLGNFALWVALWPLTFTGVIPLWLASVVSTISITLCYLPDHEAQHSNIARRGEPLRWLNETVGHLATIPLVLPYKIAWLIHQEHHAHTNDPALDPDVSMNADSWMGAIAASLRARQPAQKKAYSFTRFDADDAAVQRAQIEGVGLNIFYFGALAALAWSGYALEAFFLWWLPRNIALTYIQVFLSWAPHQPMNETGRYRDTMAWKYFLGNFGALGMEYHIVHHLHPTIPLNKTPAAYREMRDILMRRGIRNDGL